jgi:murein tripeptide amidase MpaA
VEELPKLGIVVMGAQHAREWVATAAALHLAHALVSNTSEPYILSNVLQHFEFHIIPVPNPDGYSYTWETDRYWYKNRQKLGPSSQCIGLDMNRNWGYKWEPNPFDVISRVSSNSAEDDDELRPREEGDPCSHWFPGHRPFEAPEVNNIANYVNTLPNLIGFVDLRSYGQMVSSPFSHSCSRMPKDAEDQMEAAIGVVNALRHTHGFAYITGRLCENLYRAPGNIVDWMYARAKIKYSYAVHLRDTGTYGFSLPAQWIRPVAEETGAMIHYLAKFIAKQLKREPEL